MTNDSIVNVTEAQAKLNKLLDQDSSEQLLASGLIAELKDARRESLAKG